MKYRRNELLELLSNESEAKKWIKSEVIILPWLPLPEDEPRRSEQQAQVLEELARIFKRFGELELGSKIDNLGLAQFGFKALPDDFFDELPALEEINLSGNELKALSENLKKLTALKILLLGGNALEFLSEAILRNLTKLEKLDLDYNQLGNLGETPFTALLNLKTLSLRFNKLEILSENVFEGLIALEVLDLEGNQISSLPENIFRKLTKLKIIDLANNELISLPPALFCGLSKLHTISLHQNQLRILPENIFQGLSQLRCIKLMHNKFHDLPKGIFRGLGVLEELYLSYNYLSTLPKGIFIDLKSLKCLYLCHNQLIFLEKSTFQGLVFRYPLVIDLDDNQLISLPEPLFADEVFNQEVFRYAEISMEKNFDFDLNNNKINVLEGIFSLDPEIVHHRLMDSCAAIKSYVLCKHMYGEKTDEKPWPGIDFSKEQIWMLRDRLMKELIINPKVGIKDTLEHRSASFSFSLSDEEIKTLSEMKNQREKEKDDIEKSIEVCLAPEQVEAFVQKPLLLVFQYLDLELDYENPWIEKFERKARKVPLL